MDFVLHNRESLKPISFLTSENTREVKVTEAKNRFFSPVFPNILRCINVSS